MRSVTILNTLLCLTKLTNQPPVAPRLPPYLPEDAGGRGKRRTVLCDGSLRGQGDLRVGKVDDGVHLQEGNPTVRKRDPICLAQT